MCSVTLYLVTLCVWSAAYEVRNGVAASVPNKFSENFRLIQNTYHTPAGFLKSHFNRIADVDAYSSEPVWLKKIQPKFLAPCGEKCSLNVEIPEKLDRYNERGSIPYQTRDGSEPISFVEGDTTSKESSSNNHHSLHRSSTQNYVGGVACARTGKSKCRRIVIEDSPAKAAIALFAEDKKRRNKRNSQSPVSIRKALPFASMKNISGVLCARNDSGKCITGVAPLKSYETPIEVEDDLKQPYVLNQQSTKGIASKNSFDRFSEGRTNKSVCLHMLLYNPTDFRRCIGLLNTKGNHGNEKLENNIFPLSQNRIKSFKTNINTNTKHSPSIQNTVYASNRVHENDILKGFGIKERDYSNFISTPVGNYYSVKPCITDDNGNCVAQISSIDIRPHKTTKYQPIASKDGEVNIGPSTRVHRSQFQDECVNKETGEPLLDHVECELQTKSKQITSTTLAPQEPELEHIIQNDRNKRLGPNYKRIYKPLHIGRRVYLHKYNKLATPTTERAHKKESDPLEEHDITEMNREPKEIATDTFLSGLNSQIPQPNQQYGSSHSTSKRDLSTSISLKCISVFNKTRNMHVKFCTDDFNSRSTSNRKRFADVAMINIYKAQEAKLSPLDCEKSKRIGLTCNNAGVPTSLLDRTAGMDSKQIEESSLLAPIKSRRPCWKFLGRVSDYNKIETNAFAPCNRDALKVDRNNDASDLAVQVHNQMTISANKLRGDLKDYSGMVTREIPRVFAEEVRDFHSRLQSQSENDSEEPKQVTSVSEMNPDVPPSASNKVTDTITGTKCSQEGISCGVGLQSTTIKLRRSEKMTAGKKPSNPKSIPEFMIARQNAQARRLANHTLMNSDDESGNNSQNQKRTPAFVFTSRDRRPSSKLKDKRFRKVSLECKNGRKKCPKYPHSRNSNEQYRSTRSDPVLHSMSSVFPDKYKKILRPEERMLHVSGEIDETLRPDYHSVDNLFVPGSVRKSVDSSASDDNKYDTSIYRNNVRNESYRDFEKSQEVYSDIIGTEGDSIYSPPPQYTSPILSGSTDLLLDAEDKEV